MRRFLGISVGLLVQVLFVVASYYNYVFLLGSPPRPGRGALAWDALLAIQFCGVHSLLLWPSVKKRQRRVVHKAGQSRSAGKRSRHAMRFAQHRRRAHREMRVHR